MLLKEKQHKKRKFKNYSKTKAKTHININTHQLFREPAFQTNKTLRKYIFEKLGNYTNNEISSNKQPPPNKKHKIEVNRRINHSKSAKIFTPITTPKSINTDISTNYIYYKKNSKILSFLNSIKNSNSHKNNNIFNTNKSFSENNSFKSNTISKINTNNIEYLFKNNTIRNNYNISYYNNFNFYKKPIKPKYSNSTFSSTISYKDINIYNNNIVFDSNTINNKVSNFSLSPSLSSEKINFSLTSRVPYRRVGNIFSRSECQFSKNNNKIKIKNNFDIKRKLLNKCKSLKYYEIYPINKREKSYNKNKIKELKEQNIYLKKMVLISRKKINMSKNQLDRLLMLQNQEEDKNCPVPMKQIKKIDSPITEIIERERRKSRQYGLNKNTEQNIHKEIILNEYLEEPLEQVPPKPYIIDYY